MELEPKAMTKSLTRRARRALAAGGGLLALGVLAPGATAAMLDINGQPIPNTGNPQGQLVSPPSVVQKLGIPATPSDDDPNAVAALGSPGDPEDDLGNALDAMGAAAAAGD